MAASRLSIRRSLLRAALSGPWQAKQFSARIGRMSRLYWSLSWAEALEARPARIESVRRGMLRIGKPRLVLRKSFAIRTVFLGRRDACPTGGGQRPRPVFDAGADVCGHGPGGRLAVARQQRFHNCQVLVGLASQPTVVVPRPGVGPRYIAQGPKQSLEAG